MNWIRLTREDGVLVCVNTAHITRVHPYQTKGEILTLLVFTEGSEVLVRETPETIMSWIPT